MRNAYVVLVLIVAIAIASIRTPEAQGSGVGGGATCAIAYVNTASVSRDVPVTLSLDFGNETITRLPRLFSNGASAVTVTPASVVTYVLTVSLYNTDTIPHTATLMSSTGSARLIEFYIPAGGNVVFDGRGDIRTTSGDSLQLRHDGAGAANAIVLTGTVVQR